MMKLVEIDGIFSNNHGKMGPNTRMSAIAIKSLLRHPHEPNDANNWWKEERKRMNIRNNGILFLILVISIACGTGCKKPKKIILTKEQEKEIEAHVVQTAPTPQFPLNTLFGDAVRLIGMDGPKNAVQPGKKVTLVYYWEVLKPPGSTWKIFGHLEGPGKRQGLDHHPIRNLYPIGRWKTGDIIIDKQTFTLDKEFKGGKAKLWVGFFDEVAWSKEKKNIRLPIVETGKAQAGKGDRAKVFTLNIKNSPRTKQATKPEKKPARYTIGKISTSPVIDGKLDEAVWRSASPTRNFVKTNGEKGNGTAATVAKFLYDDTHLYLGVHVKDDDIQSPFTNRDDTLWKADVVEFFVRTLKAGDEYAEIQINPANTLFDAHFKAHRNPAWEEAASSLNLNIESAVHLDGTLNKGDDKDKSWSAELKIPILELPGMTDAPRSGQTWEANLYRIDKKASRKSLAYRTWTGVGNDFHKLKGAGLIRFGPELAVKKPAAKVEKKKEEK